MVLAADPGAGRSPVARRGQPAQTKVRRPELSVSWRTLAGWWDEPGQLSRMGAITAGVARELARAAAADPTCTWRVVVTDAGGQVIAVTRVRWPDRGRRKSGHPPGPGTQPAGADAHPPGPGAGRTWRSRTWRARTNHRDRACHPPGRAATQPPVRVQQLSRPGPALQAILGAATASQSANQHPASQHAVSPHGTSQHAVSPHADGDNGTRHHGSPCTHAHAVPGYRIPDRMRDLIEVRDQVCGFPICRRPASRCDLDHTVPYDQGGLTCPCNISGGCRHDHRMKGSTAWRLRQPRPGTLIWTAPSGLSWTVTPEAHVA